MNLPVLLTTFGLILVAEIGDKTQLAAMALATRFSWRRVFWGTAVAFVVLNLLAVAVGKAVLEAVPLPYVRLMAAAIFIWFGVAALRSQGEEVEDAEGPRWRRGPFLTGFLLILVAELGDKTQLMTAGLSAQYDEPVSVFAGSTLALWAVTLVGMILGVELARRMPLSVVRRGAGGVFLICGGVTLLQGIRELVG